MREWATLVWGQAKTTDLRVRRLIFCCLRPDRLLLEVSVRAHALSIITKFALLFKIGLIVLAE